MLDPQSAAIRIMTLRQTYASFQARPWDPPLNLYETDVGVELVAELAGVRPADLEIHVHPLRVTFSGVRQLAVPPGLRRVEQMEIVSGPFQVELALARPVDPERAEARYNAGLLELRVPFAQQTIQRVVVVPINEGGTR